MKPWIVIAGVLLFGLYQLGQAPDADMQSAPPAAGPIGWSTALANDLGNVSPSPEMVRWIDSWIRAEGTRARNNPLATTQPMPGSTTFNSDGVQEYLSAEDGLEATVLTLQSDHAGYSDIVAGIQSNDVERAFLGLRASPWGTQADLAAQVYNEQMAPPAGAIASAPIGLDGDCGENVRLAVNANGGALQHIVIAPGETFSFNATLGDPEIAGYRSCAGVPGGNWCNLAARYAQVGRALGMNLQFLHHGVDLGAGIENDVLIWNIGGVAGFADGRQDLLMTNTTNRSVTFHAVEQDGALIVTGASI